METLFSNPTFNATNSLMQQGLPDILKGGFNLSDLHFDILNGKQESVSSSSPENNASSPSTPPAFPALMSFAVSEKPYECDADCLSLRDKLRQALLNIIPHKSSLQLQVLVAYTVDDNKKDVIVINETFNEKNKKSLESASGNTTTTNAASKVLDLSQKPEENSPPNLSSALSIPKLPAVNILPNQNAAPLGFPPQPSNSALNPLNQEGMMQLLQLVLGAGPANPPLANPLQPPVNPFSFSLPLNIPPLNQPPNNSNNGSGIEIKPFTEIAPNVTITSCDNILPGSQIGGGTTKPAVSLTNTNDSGSRGSSPLSNHGSISSPNVNSFRTQLPKVPSQVSFSRRYAHPRRFICNQCREQFSSLSDLTRHTLDVHSSFRCNYCNAKFTQRSNLQRHSLKHVGFKPFTCNICNKEYYRKDHLVRHIEVTHPEVDPRLNITTRLSSSECLEFLDNLHLMNRASEERGKFEESNHSAHSSIQDSGPQDSPAKSDEGSMLTNEGPALTPSGQGDAVFSIDQQSVEQSDQHQPMEN